MSSFLLLEAAVLVMLVVPHAIVHAVDERLTPAFMRDPLKHYQEPNPSDGSFSYSLPLRVPPGRNGFQPSLALSYNSGSGRSGDLFGYGWSINIPYIQLLNKKGLDVVYSGTSTPFFYSSLDGELATTTANGTSTYGAKIESGDFRQYTYSTTTGWTVTDKNGITYRFGTTTDARQDKPGDTSKIFKWMLEEARDPNGNYIYYSYAKSQGEIYPAKITYTNATSSGIFAVEFLREARGETATSSAAGFVVQTQSRIYEIDVEINGAWVTRYALAYTTGDNGSRSLLRSITESGKDENGNTTTLPPTSFDYQTLNSSQKGWSRDTGWSHPEYFSNGGTDDAGTRLGEVNGDGLIDILRNEKTNTPDNAYTNNGVLTKGWTVAMTVPSTNIEFSDGARDTGTRLFDANGDGLIDLIKSKDTGSGVYINNGDGTGWTASSSWTIPVLFTSTDGLTDYGVRFGDINGDGLVDLVQALQGSTTARGVFLNKGNSTGWAFTATPEVPSQYDFTDGTHDLGVRLDDVTGDGLADMVTNGSSVHRNTGNGWSVDSNWSVPQAFALSPGGQDTGTRLIDVNGDGLADLIRAYKDNVSTTTAQYINTGGSWTSSSDWLPSVVFSNSSGNGDPGTRIADANGDGLPDILHRLGSASDAVYMNSAVPADLLTTITESSGGRTSIGYKSSAQYMTGASVVANPNLPYVLQTVNTITRNDGFGNIGTTTYNYSGGDYYFKNSVERRLAGFEIVAKTDPAGNVTKTFYHQGNTSSSTKGEYNDDYFKIGQPWRVEVYDASGNLVSKTINKWDELDLGGNDRRFVKLHQAVDFAYDGDADHRELATSYTYNATGSVIGKVEWGEVSGSDDGTFSDTGTDLASTSIAYVASSTGSLLLPSQETVRDSTGAKVKETAFYYDNTSATSSSISKGNLTKTARWITGTSYASTSRAYTPFGLVSGESDARGATTTYTYDRHQLYIATSTNPLGQVTHNYYDYSLGKVSTTTDPNSRSFATVYDGFDRVKEIKEPDLLSPSTLVPKTTYAYTDSGSRNIKESHYQQAGTTTDVYRFLDGFDRVVQELKESEDPNTYVVRDFDYDRRGLLEKESIPYFATSSTVSVPGTGSITLQEDFESTSNGVAITDTSGGLGFSAAWSACGTEKGNSGSLSGSGSLRAKGTDSAATCTRAFPAINAANTEFSFWILGNRSGSSDQHNFIIRSGGNSNINIFFALINNQFQVYDNTTPVNLAAFAANTAYHVTLKAIDYTNGVETFAVKIDGVDVGNGVGAYSNTYRMYNYTVLNHSAGSDGLWMYFGSGGGGAGYAYWDDFTGTQPSLQISTTTATTSTYAYTNHYYDALGRLASSSNAFGVTTYTYDDWRSTTTDPLSHSKGTEKDAFGNLVRVNEVNGTSTYATLYEYDRQGNLTRITDASGNFRNFTYDGLGRRLTAEDLHGSGDATFGTWTFTYDDAGNLTSQIDPKSQTVNFTYDGVNRVLTENYTGQGGVEIQYAYDSCTEGVGRLCSASTTAATTTFAYYANGLKRTETQVIGTTTSMTMFAYDRQGNTTDITYPDSASTHYTYNNAGLIETISHRERGAAATTTLVEDFDYGPHGKPTFEDFFNDTVSTSTYDVSAMWRLTSKSTVGNQVHGASWMASLHKLLGALFLPRSYLAYANAAELIEDSAIPRDEEPSPTVEAAATPEQIDTSSATSSAFDTTIDLTPPVIQEAVLGAATTTDPTTDAVSGASPDSLATTSLSQTPAEEAVVGSSAAQQLETLQEQITDSSQSVSSTTEVASELVPPAGASGASSPLLERPDLLSWNTAYANEVAPGIVEAEFHGKWVRYLDADGVFRSIDPTLVPVSGGWQSTKMPFEVFFPERSTGTAVFHNTNRWDVHGKRVITDSPLDMSIVALGVTDVPGQLITGDLMVPSGLHRNVTYVLYEGAYPQGDLIYYIDFGSAPCLEKLIRFNSAPADLTYDFELSFSSPVDFFRVSSSTHVTWDGTGIADIANGAGSRKSDGDPQRGIGFKPFRIWDSNNDYLAGRTVRNMQPIEATFQASGTAIILTKRLPASFFTHAVYPVFADTTSTFYPDPNTETNTVDGHAAKDGGTSSWSTIRGANGNVGNDSAITFQVTIGPNGASTYQDLYRGFSSFDTSPIPDSDSITSATYSLYGYLKVNTLAQSVRMVQSTLGSPTAVSASDYEGTVSNTTAQAPELTGASMTTSGYNDFALNETGLGNISKTGVSYFGIRGSYDAANTDPAGTFSSPPDYNQLAFYSADQTGTSSDPKLVVTYGAPPPPPPPSGGIQALSYTYDLVGNITRIQDFSNSSTSKIIDFGYDDLYRLTTASTSYASTSPDYRRTWGYAPTGNLATSSTLGNYSYEGNTGGRYENPHAATAIGSMTLEYDRNGDLATTTGDGTTWRYLWDYRNRLTQAATGTATTTFAYDYTGDRVQLAVNGAATATYPNKFYNVSDATTTKHIFAGDRLVATVVGNGVSTSTYVVHTDHLGGTHVVTNASGTVVQTLDYFPYGDTRLSSGSISEQRRFTGHEFDSSTDLTYMRARYYTGARGQFLSQDPAFHAVGTPELKSLTGRDPPAYLSDPQNMNSYAYARNNPLGYRDPNGKYGVLALMGLGAGANFGAQGLEDYISGNPVQWQNYAGAAAGGFVGTGALLGAQAIGLGPISGPIAGAVTNSVEETTSQSLRILAGRQDQFNGAEIVRQGGTGLVFGGLPLPKLVGVTAGQGSFNAITKQITTKLLNGTIQNFGVPTAGKILTVQGIGAAPEAISRGFVQSPAGQQAIQSILSGIQTTLQAISQQVAALTSSK